MTGSFDGIAEARRRIAEEAARRTGRLDLRDLGLAALPEELFALTHLRELDLGASPLWAPGHRPNAIDTQRAGVGRLTALERLSLAWSDLTDLDFVRSLSALGALDCSGTGVADLAPLAGLTALQTLDCSGTGVIDLGSRHESLVSVRFE